MNKSLLSKYFLICSSMILISMTFLGIVLLVFASQYFTEDKYSLLEKTADQAVTFTVSNWQTNDYQQVESSVLKPLYTLLGTTIDADVYLVDVTTGGTMLCSHSGGGTCNHMSAAVAKEALDAILVDGRYARTGNLGGLYENKYYNVGKAVYDDSGCVAGAVFVSSSAAGMTAFLVDIFQMFVISAALVLIFSFVIIYFITSNMIKPLQDMLAATRSFSKGDFSVRVPVQGDDEIAMLSEAFNSMAGDLATMESMRRSFTANVSHELKTPMTTIAGFIDGILDGTIPREKQDYYLKIVSEEVKRLSRLVRSMLAISRIEAGEMVINPQPVDISESVTRTVLGFEQKIDAKHIDVQGLSVDKYMVEADEDLIYQVVYNLVDNAVKFVSDGGVLSFSFREEGGRTYVAIRNSGAGLEPEEIPKLFERFYKSDKSRSLDKNGVGLGLYIVKTIVNIHSGDILVRSEKGRYTEFTLVLPTAPKPKNIFRKPKPQRPEDDGIIDADVTQID